MFCQDDWKANGGGGRSADAFLMVSSKIHADLHCRRSVRTVCGEVYRRGLDGSRYPHDVPALIHRTYPQHFGVAHAENGRFEWEWLKTDDTPIARGWFEARLVPSPSQDSARESPKLAENR